MENINIEDIIYDANRKKDPTYVEIIVKTALFVDMAKSGEITEEDLKKLEARTDFFEIFNPIHESYSRETKSEIASVTQLFSDIIAGPKKEYAVEDMKYLYRNYLSEFIFGNREASLSRLHAAVKLYIGYNVGYLKTEERNMGEYNPARK